jgi:hypothetical protein
MDFSKQAECSGIVSSMVCALGRKCWAQLIFVGKCYRYALWGFFFGLYNVKVRTFLLKMMANRCFVGFLVAKSHISLFEKLQKFCIKFQLGRK